MTARPATIALEGISFTYPGTTVGVHDVDLAIEAGELLAVIGASGCGKSTLLRLIAGFIKPSQGRVIIDGEDAAHIPPRLRNIGIVFQSYTLFPHMTAAENVAYPLKLRGEDRRRRTARAADMLARVGLAGHVDKLPAQLSGGQQQRVALARALVFEPRALLLDEPLSALDAALRVEMRDEIRRLQREHAIATLHITHDQEEALSMADRVAVMQQGRIVQVGAPRDIYAHPANRAIAEFVGHANLWSGRVAGPQAVETPLGVLRTAVHGRSVGDNVAVLVRPERIEIGEGENAVRGRIIRDRFLGSFRRFDFQGEKATLLVETAAPGTIEVVHIPAQAVQILPESPTMPTGR